MPVSIHGHFRRISTPGHVRHFLLLLSSKVKRLTLLKTPIKIDCNRKFLTFLLCGTKGFSVAVYLDEMGVCSLF